MLGPTSKNNVTGSQDVTQIGHNFGTVSIGLSFEQHEANDRERLAEMRADLERAHGAERALLQAQIDAGNSALRNLQQDYESRLAELTDLRQTLAQYHNQIDTGRHAAADAALERGDMTLARALLGELAAQARARREDASKEEARLEFKLGEIAEAEIRWADAATHYTRAARLDPSFNTLFYATHFTQLSGEYRRAERLALDCLALARAGDDPAALSRALDNYATVLHRLGRHSEAERTFKQALKICRATVGEGHPDYAGHLNNLAGAVWAQGRFAEAERLYREALNICRATVGEGHTYYATNLNNLAGVLVQLDRPNEARPLYEQALAILRVTLPPDHPHIQNLQGKLSKLP